MRIGEICYLSSPVVCVEEHDIDDDESNHVWVDIDEVVGVVLGCHTALDWFWNLEVIIICQGFLQCVQEEVSISEIFVWNLYDNHRISSSSYIFIEPF